VKCGPTATELEEAWQSHPKFTRRALGGRRALDGFHYQFAVSLKRFFEVVLSGGVDAEVAFEGLSDLSEARPSGLTYLVQVKTTLDTQSLRAAIDEALAVDEFLEDAFPSVRAKFLFRITARSIRGNPALRPGELSGADLKLKAAAARRWDEIRDRCLPVELASMPEIELASLLWRDVRRPITLVDACMGRLLDLLASAASPPQIAKELQSLWQESRRATKAPLHLLGPGELTAKSDSRRIVHGVRPSVDDMRDGCFMERNAELDAAVTAIRTRWKAGDTASRARVPVFWISGPSGAGKSVMLLQLAKQLLTDGDIEAVNFIESYAHVLPSALDDAAGTAIPTIVVGDDLFSPDNRDHAIWRQIGELAATERFPSRFAVMTCGPQEQLRAFRRECERHRELEAIEIPIAPLDEQARARYHSWYEERTGTRVPLSREDIFVAVAWMYELHREQQLTPEAFSRRFDERLEALGMARAGHSALALNIYGLIAPEPLFRDHRAELAELVGERVWRLASPAAGTMAGRFFHPQISRVIYDILVPPSDIMRRAEDIAHGFEAMLDQGEPADAFLDWLGSTKAGKSRARGALMLEEPMRVAILRALWPRFEARGPTEQMVPRLRRWHQAMLSAGIDLDAAGIKSRVAAWWRETDDHSEPWSLLFQMVWDAATVEERAHLAVRAQAWLAEHFEARSWQWIFKRVRQSMQGDSAIRELGYRWLEAHPSQVGWPTVWGELFDDCQERGVPEPDREQLVRLALAAIPVQPEGEPELAIWDRTGSLGGPRPELLHAVLHKLTTVRSPHKVERGVDLLLRYIADGQVVSSLSPALHNSVGGPAWNYVWRTLLQRRPRERDLLPLGRDWLAGREAQPDWAFVWQKLIDHDFERETLLPIGRAWLDGRETQPEWTHVWEKLIDHDFECETLLPIGRAWLIGRETQPEWAFVWEKLIDQDFERETLLPIGRAWLIGRETQPDWAFVWQKLIDQDFERETLLPIGRAWLDGRDTQPEWAFVWQKLIDQDFERETLLPIGRAWLDGRETQPDWAFVWEKLIDHDFEREALLPIGRDWLIGREAQPDWAYVWQKLIDHDFERETQLPIGRDWLIGRESQPEWAFVWRKLVDTGYDRPRLIVIGRQWVSEHRGRPGSHLVSAFAMKSRC